MVIPLTHHLTSCRPPMTVAMALAEYSALLRLTPEDRPGARYSGEASVGRLKVDLREDGGSTGDFHIGRRSQVART